MFHYVKRDLKRGTIVHVFYCIILRDLKKNSGIFNEKLKLLEFLPITRVR